MGVLCVNKMCVLLLKVDVGICDVDVLLGMCVSALCMGVVLRCVGEVCVRVCVWRSEMWYFKIQCLCAAHYYYYPHCF